MYIDEIYSILDETIDKVFTVWINKENNKLIQYEKISKEKNFKKYQSEINSLLEYLFLLIDQDKIKKLVKKNRNIDLINSVIEKYICYYVFLFIGLTYKNTLNHFNNNIIEISKDQMNYNLVVDDFFTSKSNAVVIKNLILLKDLNEYLLSNKKKTNELNYFLNNYGIENFEKIEKYLKDKNIEVKFTNIIKLIISINIFDDKEKKNLFEEIETSEISTGEFMFIDVMIPKSQYIELKYIEDVLTEKQIEDGYIEIIYNLINQNEIEELDKFKNFDVNYDKKIQKLFDLKIVIPIVDDFLLYHKDYFKYIQTGEEENNIKTRDNTRLKFIINKINNVKNYYKNKSENEKLFYQPFKNKRYFLYNINENDHILSSSEKIIKMNTENSILLSELSEYNNYPFVSFNSYDKTYIVYNGDTTIEAIRSVSFINKNEIEKLQTRIINNDMFVNVVGLAFIDDIKKNLSDIKTSNFEELSIKNIMDNIKQLIIDKLKKINFNTQISEKMEYTFFDLKTQKYGESNENVKNNENDKMKFILSSLYDFVIISVLKNIKNHIKHSNNNFIINNVDLLNCFNRKYTDLNNEEYKNEYNNLLYYIYFIKSYKLKNYEDLNEYIFKGLTNDIQKLPIYNEKQKIKKEFLKFSTTSVKEKKEILDISTNISSNVICQHIVSWNKIRKYDENAITEFFNQYAEINKNNLYICKSCGFKLDIDNYILQGSFDSKEDNFKMTEPVYSGKLEDIKEYEKYNIAIKSVKKLIERMATVFKISEMLGNTYNANVKIKILTKDTIDLLIYQKKELDNMNYIGKIQKSLNEKTGIPIKNPDLNSFFVFFLDNSIFIKSSSNSMDYMKIIKYNHIISLITILLILDMTELQIYSLHNDKTCSFDNFTKNYMKVINKQKIIINNNHDVEFLNKYPVLCYLMFLFSCIILKYNLWGMKITAKEFAISQLNIINTMVEILNSILIINEQEMIENKIYLYEKIFRRYYKKLGMFSDKNIINNLKEKYSLKTLEKNGNLVVNKYDMDVNSLLKIPYIINENYFKYVKTYNLKLNKLYELYKNHKNYYQITNLSNCDTGHFHIFINKNKKLICKLCGVEANIKLYNPNDDEKIKNNYVEIYLKKLSKKYCLDGKFHQFINNRCKYCNYNEFEEPKYNLSQLIKMYNVIQKTKHMNNLKSIELEKNIQKNIKNNKNDTIKIINKIFYKFQKYNNNLLSSVDILLEKIQEIMGKNININKTLYNLYEDYYVLTHDFDGKIFSKPEKIVDEKNKVKIIENHSIYNTDVISIIIERNVKYEAVFDIKTLFLLGYKKIGKEFIDVNHSKCKLQIFYSIKSMITYFGFSRIIPFNTDYYFDNDDYNMQTFINKSASYRFEAIKKLGYNIKKYISRFHNQYPVNIVKSKEFVEKELIETENKMNNDILNILYNKTKINNLIIQQKDNNITHVFMKYFNIIYDYIPFQQIKEVLNKSNKIKSSFLIKNDFSSNVILNYIIDEIIRLINYNTNKNTKQNILTFLLTLIVDLFSKYNLTLALDKINYYSQIIINDYEFLTEYKIQTNKQEENLYEIDTQDLTEEEKEKLKDLKMDEEETLNAIDVDSEDEERDNEMEDYEME